MTDTIDIVAEAPAAGADSPRPAGRTRLAWVGLGWIGASAAFLLTSLRSSVPTLSLALLLLALALAVRVSRERSLVGVYVGAAAISFVVAPVIKGDLPFTTRTTWLLISLWFGGWSLGQYVATKLSAAKDARSRPSDRRAVDPRMRTAVLLVGASSLAVQWFLIRQGAVGYGAQVRGLVSVGPLAIFASVGPAALAATYVMTRLYPAPTRRRVVVLGLVALQCLALAATGFRGAGPVYLLTLWLVVKRWDPVSRWGARHVAGIVLAAIAMLVLFNYGAGARRQQAGETTILSHASGLESIAGLPALAVKRLDLLPSAHAAIDRADLPAARQTVSATSQVAAFVPRVLWRGKPTVDYGQRVSKVFFDVPEIYRTSSSITWIGDLFVQGGPGLIFLVAVAVGAVFNRVLRLRSRPDPVSIACYFLSVQILLTLESALLFSIAAALRTLIALVVSLFAARVMLRILNAGAGTDVAAAEAGGPTLS